jgi:ParB family chromosome partitioning protein
LGRGLEALLGRPLPSETSGSADVVSPLGGGGAACVRLDQIDVNPYQPRREFDAHEIAELSASLAQHGLLQPLVVRRHEGRYQLIAGERRMRAALQAGWQEVATHIVEADDRQMAELAMVENLQRKDLNALEKAACFEQYLTSYGCTQDELAQRLDLDRSTIANLIRLLELPVSVQAAVRSQKITPGHARALLPLGDETRQSAVCRQIETEGLSVRATEDLIKDLLDAEDGPQIIGIHQAQGKPAARRSAQHMALEQEIKSATGCKVKISRTAKGAGKLVLSFANEEEFSRLRELLTSSLPQRNVS